MQPAKIELTDKQRNILKKLVSKTTSEQRIVQRAKIILLSGAKKSNSYISREIGVSRKSVIKWRKRFSSNKDILRVIEGEVKKGTIKHSEYEEQIEKILLDLPRPGSPGDFSAEEVCQIISVACENPQDSGRAVTNWTDRELALEVIKRKIVKSISPSTVRRFLKSGGLKATQN